MAKSPTAFQGISLAGLEMMPAQVWRGIRLVPLRRTVVKDDLHLAKRTYDDRLAVVAPNLHALRQGTKYVSYVPHGLILSWSDDGSPVAAFGGRLSDEAGKGREGYGGVRLVHRMARREGPNRLRILPMHLAMEGFLLAYFQGPEIAWPEYANSVMAGGGLSPRTEWSLAGRSIPGLADALRTFEIHDGQVGVLLFVANALASAFVVPHPDDYRALHGSLLEDFFGAVFYHYAKFDGELRLDAAIDGSRVLSLGDLRRGFEWMKKEWSDFHEFLGNALFDRSLGRELVYRAGPFSLIRFATSFDPHSENHVGEAILRDDGGLEYLKTFRLSSLQTKRAYLLSVLATHRWNIKTAAVALNQSEGEFVVRLENAGFGYILRPHVLERARRRG